MPLMRLAARRTRPPRFASRDRPPATGERAALESRNGFTETEAIHGGEIVLERPL
jgi:hypothetical protein